VGNSSPENFNIPRAQGFIIPEGSSGDSARNKVKELSQPAGCKATARVQVDGPVIWEALVLPRKEARGRPLRGNQRSGQRGRGSRRVE
jgi:hypothetical protein